MTSIRNRSAIKGLALTFFAVIAHGAAPAFAQESAQPIASAIVTSHDEKATMWNTWVDIWNGDFSSAGELISPNFRIHVTLLDGSSDAALRGPSGLTGWIVQTRPLFPDLEFTTIVGPIIDGDHMAGHWSATGTYAGGFPGATAKVGTVVTFTGTDVLRISGNQLAEYWLVTDTAMLLTQLGVGAR